MHLYHQWSKRRRSAGATLHCWLHCLISTGPGDTSSRSHRANHRRATVLDPVRAAELQSQLSVKHTQRRGGRLRSSSLHSSVRLSHRAPPPGPPACPDHPAEARDYNTSGGKQSHAHAGERREEERRGGEQLEGRPEKRARLSVLVPRCGCKECEGGREEQHRHRRHTPPVSPGLDAFHR